MPLMTVGAGRALLRSPAAAASGPTTVYEPTLSGSEAGFGFYGVRDVIAASNLAAATGQYVKVTLSFPSIGDTTTIVAYIGQQAAAGDAWDTTAMTQLTGGDFGAGTYTKVGSGALTIASAFVLLNEAYDETKSYVASVKFDVSSAAIYKLSDASNRTFYKFGADASEANASGYNDNGAFTTFVAKIEIQATA